MSPDAEKMQEVRDRLTRLRGSLCPQITEFPGLGQFGGMDAVVSIIALLDICEALARRLLELERNTLGDGR